MTIIGPPTWVDLACSDVAAESAFYAGLLGWEYREAHPGAGGWVQADVDGKAAAGLAPRYPGTEASFWTIFFTTDDVASAVTRATQLGATTLAPPMRVEIGGEHKCTIAVLADPSGAAFGLTEPGTHTGFEVHSGQGSAAWFELMTRELPAALDFYTALLRAEARDAPDVPMPYTLLSVDGQDFGGAMAMPPMVPPEVPPNWSVYFAVDDAEAATAYALEAGANVLMGPEKMSAGTIASLMDPDGANVNIIQLPQE